MGITRVANITGLDRIGIPVYNAFRPQSRSISVSQGKGSDALSAKVSAIMESVETFHAESIDSPPRFGSINALKEQLNLADTGNMARAGHTKLTDNDAIYWIEGENLYDGRAYWLPLELVSTDYTLPNPEGCGYFAANSNGLASGNSLIEAQCHAVYEVIERDAEALWNQQPDRIQAATGVNTNSINDINCRYLLDKFAAANIETRIWDISSDVNLPCFTCLAIGDEHDWADPEFGTGCHASKEVALARALTEAAQARTTFIAGSRDDIGLSEYRHKQRRKRRAQGLKQLQTHLPERDFDQLTSNDNVHIDDDLELCLKRLAQIGIGQVLSVNLSKAEFGLSVVKVVIPGLEGAHGHWHGAYVPGRRAKKLLNLPFNIHGE
jgi:ribosomal protein S12 methylthiotransferase accessory factor